MSRGAWGWHPVAAALAAPSRLPQPRRGAALDPAERQADALGQRLGEALPRGAIGPGRLPAPAVRIAEEHLGLPMSGVDLRADQAARVVTTRERAAAVTEGSTVSFARGVPSMGTADGRALLGHELVHVAQQRAHGAPSLQRKPIKDAPLASKLVSVALRQTSKPLVARQRRKGADTIDLLMSRPLEVEATAQFASGADAAGLTFGFFQLGRPFELYRATMRKVGADPGSSGDDLSLDLTSRLRSRLPLPDHSTGARFFASLGQSQTATADAGGKVSMKYSDLLSTPIPADIQKGGIYYGLTGIAAQSFLFTAFGAWDGTDAIILSTFYWDMKHCEAIQPGDVNTAKSFGPINVAPFRDCKAGGCDLSEPGASQFGQPASESFLSWVGTTILGSIQNPAAYAGPSTFSIGCQTPGGKAAKRGRTE